MFIKLLLVCAGHCRDWMSKSQKRSRVDTLRLLRRRTTAASLCKLSVGRGRKFARIAAVRANVAGAPSDNYAVKIELKKECPRSNVSLSSRT